MNDSVEITTIYGHIAILYNTPYKKLTSLHTQTWMAGHFWVLKLQDESKKKYYTSQKQAGSMSGKIAQ